MSFNSYLFVGIYPQWDKNPFFFELEHDGNESGGPFGRGKSKSRDLHPVLRRQFSYTLDDIYNLDFGSAGPVCEENGDLCRGYFYSYGAGLFDLEYLDLSKASVQRATVGNSSGYQVQGNQTSWIANGTADPWFNVRGCDHFEEPEFFFYWYVYDGLSLHNPLCPLSLLRISFSTF